MVLECFVLIEMWVFQLDIIIKKFQDQIMHLLKMTQVSTKKLTTKPLNESLEMSV